MEWGFTSVIPSETGESGIMQRASSLISRGAGSADRSECGAALRVSSVCRQSGHVSSEGV